MTDTRAVVRRAALADADDIARVQVDTWRSTYMGIIPQKFLDDMSYEAHANRWRDMLAGGRGARSREMRPVFHVAGCHFYEAIGGVLVQRRTIEIGGAQVEELGYGWRDLGTLTATYLGKS